MNWPETTVATAQGPMAAIAPCVISASRATDIPAFHARWFMERLRAGHCLWENPFNPRQKRYVSFERCAVIVFWSKDPRPLLPWLSEIAARGYQFYFQFTLNDYEAEGLEPGVPALDRRIATFQELSERIGRERVIWRFDPLIMGGPLTVERMVGRIDALAEQLAPYTEKFVFSFLDMYKKTAGRLRKIDPGLRRPTAEEAQRLTQAVVRRNAALPTPLRLATCAEPPWVAEPCVEANSCIDPGLLLRLCPDSADIQRLCGRRTSAEQGALLALPPTGRQRGLKDSGQRPRCGCVPSKDIGSYSTCMHFCAYCYANGSRARVMERAKAAEIGRERL